MPRKREPRTEPAPDAAASAPKSAKKRSARPKAASSTKAAKTRGAAKKTAKKAPSPRPLARAARTSKPGATEKASRGAKEKGVAFDSESYHEAIARLAYHFWEERGRAGGSPEDDWHRAEAEVRRTVLAARR